MNVRFPLMLLAAIVFAGGVGLMTQAASAQDKEHAAGHDHAAGEDHDGHEHASMEETEKAIADSLATLSAEDQKLATAQRYCPIMAYSRLGADGAPIKLMISGKPVFVCCKGCVADANKDASVTLKKAEQLKKATATLAKLSKEEQTAIESQKYCAVQNDSLLGSMGAPVKLEIDGGPVYLCCAGCKTKAEADPAATLAKVEELKKAGMKEDHEAHDHDAHDHDAAEQEK